MYYAPFFLCCLSFWLSGIYIQCINFVSHYILSLDLLFGLCFCVFGLHASVSKTTVSVIWQIRTRSVFRSMGNLWGCRWAQYECVLVIRKYNEAVWPTGKALD